MELESNLRENLSSHQMLSSENYAQVCKKDEFPFQVFGSKANYLQEFHHLDHFHPVGSSSNPVIADENLCSFDPFNPYAYGCSSNNRAEDLYEYKACADQNGGCGQVMDNFQTGDCYNFHQRNHIDAMGLERNSIPLNFPDIKPISFVVPDEVSCITSGNAHIQKAIMNKNATFPSLLRISKGRKKPTVIKGQWTVEEDRLLVQLVEQYGVRKWSHIAQMLPGRIGKQCRERWHNHLRPDIKKDTWSEEEDRVLIEAHAEIGNKWAEIAKRLPGRTENSIKNHWNATKRRQYSKRKCRSKYPRCSLLQDYIKSLNLESNPARHQKKNSATSAVNNTKTKSTGHQAQTTELCPNEWLVSNFDFKDDAEFYFDDNFFQEGCSINSLMEDIPGGPVDDANNYDRKRHNTTTGSVEYHQKNNLETEKLQYFAPYVIDGKLEADKAAVDAAAATMEFEVKKELDLVEMITQVNGANKMK